MAAPLTPEELAEVDTITTIDQHRAFCDKIKDVRGGQYPCDWYEKMLKTGKNDEVVRRCGADPGFKIKSFDTIEELFRELRVGG